MTTIRPAYLDDADALAQLAEQTFRDTFTLDGGSEDMDLYCRDSFSGDIQRQELLDTNYVTFVAEADGKLVGFAQLLVLSHKEGVDAKCPAELHRLYVLNDWQGQGVAQGLMNAVLAAAEGGGDGCVGESDTDIIWLGVWEHNPRAIRFYEKNGFKEVGEHVFQLGDDAQRDLLMVRDVIS